MQNLLKRPTVEQMTGKSRSVLYRDMADGVFPKPIRIGARAVVWIESEVVAWLEARKTARDGQSI